MGCLTIMLSLLDKICENSKMKYTISSTTFKKARAEIQLFLEECKPFYPTSKIHYLERSPFQYKHFLTVIRQICKSNQLKYESSILYNHSSYEIIYYVYKSMEPLVL